MHNVRVRNSIRFHVQLQMLLGLLRPLRLQPLLLPNHHRALCRYLPLPLPRDLPHRQHLHPHPQLHLRRFDVPAAALRLRKAVESMCHACSVYQLHRQLHKRGSCVKSARRSKTLRMLLLPLLLRPLESGPVLAAHQQQQLRRIQCPSVL